MTSSGTTLGASDDGIPRLQNFLTKESTPLGPPETEPLVGTSDEVFRQLYDDKNHTHVHTRKDSPSYIVGRKGAGKTAFLIGTAVTQQAEVVLVGSEDVYGEVNELRLAYTKTTGGPLVTDHLAHVWEVVLFHAALYGISVSTRLAGTQDRQQVWGYVSGFGHPESLQVDHLLAVVTGKLKQAVTQGLAGGGSFRDRCWSIGNDRGRFADAAAAGRHLLASSGPESLYVVVDNLEDLHEHLDAFAPVVAALFRHVTHNRGSRHRCGSRSAEPHA